MSRLGRYAMCGAIFIQLAIQNLNIVYASPSDETRKFMNDSLSVFDMGIYRLGIDSENALAHFKDRVNGRLGKEFMYYLDSQVRYVWQSDEIIIKWSINYDSSIPIPWKSGNEETPIDSQDKVNKLCLLLLDKMEGSLLGQSDMWDDFGKDQLQDYFGHAGYLNSSISEKDYRSIASKVIYQAVVWHDTKKTHDRQNKKIKPVKCKIGFDDPLDKSTPIYQDVGL